jgi:hypothetical protein
MLKTTKGKIKHDCIMYGMGRVNVYCLVSLFFLNYVNKLAVSVHIYFGMSNLVASKKQCNIEVRNK